MQFLQDSSRYFTLVSDLGDNKYNAPPGNRTENREKFEIL